MKRGILSSVTTYAWHRALVAEMYACAIAGELLRELTPSHRRRRVKSDPFDPY